MDVIVNFIVDNQIVGCYHFSISDNNTLYWIEKYILENWEEWYDYILGLNTHKKEWLNAIYDKENTSSHVSYSIAKTII